MNSVKCHNCSAVLEIDGVIDEGDVCSCPDCEAELDLFALHAGSVSESMPQIKPPTSAKKKLTIPKGGTSKSLSDRREPSQQKASTGARIPNSSYISSVRDKTCYSFLRGFVKYFTAISIIGAACTHILWIVSCFKVESYALGVGAIFSLLGSIFLIIVVYQAVYVYIDIGDVLIDMGNRDSRRD